MELSSIASTREEVVAENGVVAGGHDLVAQAGVQIMQQGGNAVDGGVAAAFVAQLAEPGMCGVGHRVVSMDAAASGGFGRPTGVSIDENGKLHAGADPLYGTGVAGF